MRKRMGLTIEELGRKCRLGHNAVARLERDPGHFQPWVLGRILPVLASQFKAAFPETNGDPYDFLIPPKSFGSWLRNFRLRRTLRLRDLADALAVRPFTIIRYEADLTKPDNTVRQRLRAAFSLKDEFERFIGVSD